MTPAELNATADAAQERYRLLNAAFDGAFQRALGLSFDAARERAFIEQMTSVARTYYATEQSLLGPLGKSLSDARRDALSHLGYSETSAMPGPLSEALAASERYLLREIATQIERDVALNLERYRRHFVEQSIIRNAGGSPRALSTRGIGYWFRDRAGRQIPSTKFIRTVWREQLVTLYVDGYLHTLAEFAERTAIVWHPDRNHGLFGMEIPLAEGLDLEALRREVFHPNSDAKPRAARWFRQNAA